MATWAKRSNRADGMPEALKRKILAAYQRLPANQRRVADFVLKQPNDLAFLTTDSLSRILKVSKATIVRLAQSLGYQGFTELQNQILDAVQSSIRNPSQPMGGLGKLKHNETITLVARHEVQNIERTVHYIDRTTFRQAIDVLLRARRVYTMGIGVSSLLAEVLSYELNQVGIESQPLESGKLRFVERLALARRGDVVVGFSFQPYSKETIDAAKYARQLGVSVIAITDKLTSPITFHAHLVLAVQTENMLHTNSISAISVVINALVTDLAVKNKKLASRMFKESARVLRQTEEFVDKKTG